MSRYTMIRSDMWGDEEFMDLDILGKNLYIYLLTSPMSNSIGYYKLPVKKIAQDMSVDENKILPILCDQTKLWKYSQETKQVLIPAYMKYNKLVSSSQLKSIGTQMELLTPSILHVDFLYAVHKYLKPEAFQYVSRNDIEFVMALIRDKQDRKSILLKSILFPLSI